MHWTKGQGRQQYVDEPELPPAVSRLFSSIHICKTSPTHEYEWIAHIRWGSMTGSTGKLDSIQAQQEALRQLGDQLQTVVDAIRAELA